MAKEPPVGRVGIVLDGFGSVGIPGRSVRCNGCREWFPASEATCPHCERSRPAFNKHIRTAQLNNHLFGLAAHAEKQKRRMV